MKTLVKIVVTLAALAAIVFGAQAVASATTHDDGARTTHDDGLR